MFKPTLKELESWGGASLLREAQQLAERGDVLQAKYEHPWASGLLRFAGRELRTRFRLISNTLIESHCPCAVNQRDGRVCTHVVAVGVMLNRRARSPERQARRAVERRHAEAVHAAHSSDAFQRRASVADGGTPAEIRLRLPADWVAQFWDGRVTVQCGAMIAGQSVPLDRLPKQRPLALSRADENLLFVLEDICEGPPEGEVELTKSDLLNILEIHSTQQRPLHCAGSPPLTFAVESAEVMVMLDLDRENGELLLFSNVFLPGVAEADLEAEVVAYNKLGWVLSDNRLWPLSRTVPGPYQEVYHTVVAIERPNVVRFLRREFPQLQQGGQFQSEIDTELFELHPATPSFSLRVKGSPASLSLTLYAQYEGGHALPVSSAVALGDFAIPDHEDILRYETRNLPLEQAALMRLNKMGIGGASGTDLELVVGERDVLNFLASEVPLLRRLGWKVTLEGRVAEFMDNVPTAVAVVHINPVGGDAPSPGGTGRPVMEGWFDVRLDLQSPDGATITPTDVQLALMRGESFLRRGEETVLFDAESVRNMRRVFNDCTSSDGGAPGTFRLNGMHAAYVQASLNELDGVDIEQPPDWRMQAERQNRQEELEPVQLGEPLDSILRPYQKEGVAWLRFMESNGISGILADEMGLGKTLQTLSWLQMQRCSPHAEGCPALIVCPTSLVDNWKHEAAKFTPNLKVITMSGAGRHAHWDEVDDYDLIITSYALLRRDIDRYLPLVFSCAILDEAQHIKNRSTQNAIVVKQPMAFNRLVLTGTPMENSVADLWSIMDFLMPDYLGDYDSFRNAYELPISTLAGEPEAEDAQRRLRNKLHPFLLRRKKRDVAKDLPEKLIKVSFCSLTPDQRVVYEELLSESRDRIGGMVAEQGFERSRIAILAILMRLRQVCCHLGLLKDEKILAKASAPSGKMEQFFELLDESIAGGHRMLVFSQFVSMLTILRQELESRGIPYCYLDGSSKDRLETCQRFNRDASIPVFLISLKAGGTGLNLTGADVVVHFDPWWNPAVEDQATDRAHRIGQKRTVYSVKLITEGTVEEKVLAMQLRKQALIGAIVESDEQTMAKLTWDDIKDILEF